MKVRSLLSRCTGLLAVGVVLVLAGCPSPAEDPCKTTVCGEGLVCVANAGAASCVAPTDPCGVNNPCKADQTCVVAIDGRGTCLTPDRCRFANCPFGKACDPATGQCTVDRKPCDGVTCPRGQACNESSGACEDANSKCNKVCCDSSEVCDPDTGDCVPDQCLDSAVLCKCGPAQVCEGVHGTCLPVTTACGGCAATEYCDVKLGRCLPITPGTPTAGEIGAACGATADCTKSGAEAFCITDGGLFGDMPGGSCSASCNVTGCPTGSGCVDIGLQICLDICLTKNDCRAGYSCQKITSDDPRRYCFPEAPSRSKCTGTACAPIGGPCEKDDDCIAGAECSKNFPGGYCEKRGCKPSDCDEAKENCRCLTADSCTGATIGLGKCSTVAQDCRAGYTCIPLTADGLTGYCYPRQCEDDTACRPANSSCGNHCDTARGYCDPVCTKNEDCIGGRTCDTTTGACYQFCRSSTANCGPDAFCDVAAQRCVHKCTSDLNCADGSYCDKDGTGKCTPKCTTDASCGDGNFCDVSGRCRARCGADGDCAGGEYCDSGRCLPGCRTSADCTLGQFCEAQTGRCRRDLKSTLVGQACTGDRECGPYNADCLTAGYPGGYCVAPGCSASEPCGPDAACVDRDGGSRCEKKCQGDTDCRPGYRCGNHGSVQVCEPT